MADEIFTVHINTTQTPDVACGRPPVRKRCTGVVAIKTPEGSAHTAKLTDVSTSGFGALTIIPVAIGAQYSVVVKAFSNGGRYESKANAMGKHCTLSGDVFKVGFKLEPLYGESLEAFSAMLKSA